MHYKNGRAARLGDQVVYKGWDGQVRAGVVTSANAGSTTCNLTIKPALGGNTDCLTASEAYHVEDVWQETEKAYSPAAAEAKAEPPSQMAATSYAYEAVQALPSPAP